MGFTIENDLNTENSRRLWLEWRRRVDPGDRMIVKITDYDLEVSGRCSFKDKTIRLNVPHSEGAFLTLAHEAGHWMSWLRYGADDDDAPWAQHERWAYLYGWVVIQKIGAAGLVSKEMWRDHHPYVVGGWSEEQTCQFYNLVEEGLSREDARHRVFG